MEQRRIDYVTDWTTAAAIALLVASVVSLISLAGLGGLAVYGRVR